MVHALASIGFMLSALGASTVIAMMLMTYRIAILSALGIAPREAVVYVPARRVRVNSVRSTTVVIRTPYRRAA